MEKRDVEKRQKDENIGEHFTEEKCIGGNLFYLFIRTETLNILAKWQYVYMCISPWSRQLLLKVQK